MAARPGKAVLNAVGGAAGAPTAPSASPGATAPTGSASDSTQVHGKVAIWADGDKRTLALPQHRSNRALGGVGDKMLAAIGVRTGRASTAARGSRAARPTRPAVCVPVRDLTEGSCVQLVVSLLPPGWQGSTPLTTPARLPASAGDGVEVLDAERRPRAPGSTLSFAATLEEHGSIQMMLSYHRQGPQSAPTRPRAGSTAPAISAEPPS